jgi:hypothetical protein
VGVTDNINLAFEDGNKIDETFQIVATTFGVNGATTRTSTNLAGNLQYYRYVHDSFDDELIGGASLNFVGDVVPERFRWRVTDNFGQQTLNPLGMIAPGNRQDVNIFRTGPDFMLPLGSRTRADLQLRRSSSSFEQSNIDSSRNDAGLSFTRQHGTVWSSSIGVSSQNVEYDDVDGFDFDRKAIFLSARATGGRTSLTISVGENRIENPLGDADGVQFSVGFNRQLAGPGTLSFSVARNFSDAGNLFRFNQDNFINVGQSQDNFATPDVFENTTGFINYFRTTPLTDWAVQGYWRKDEFQTQTQFNRDEFGVRFVLRRSLGARWELGVNGGSVRRDLQGLREEDDTHIWSFELMRRIGRTLGVGFDRQFIRRDQGRVGFDRKENRYSVFFNYQRQRSGIVREPVLDTL